jgi:preprotein translocase subunit YajC
VKDLAGFLPFVLIALVFWFLIVRPQRRRQQELTATQSSLRPGAEVMLGSGIFGTVVSLDEETLQIELAPGTVVKVARQAVVRVIDTPDGVGTVDVRDDTRAAHEDRGDDQTDQTDQHHP